MSRQKETRQGWALAGMDRRVPGGTVTCSYTGDFRDCFRQGKLIFKQGDLFDYEVLQLDLCGDHVAGGWR